MGKKKLKIYFNLYKAGFSCLIEDDTGEMNTVIEDERSALEIAKYIFIKVHYGMRVKVTMYYDKDGNTCSDSDDWEDHDTLLDLCSPNYE